jgi:hypothetical protein
MKLGMKRAGPRKEPAWRRAPVCFITDQSGKTFCFCPLWGKKYFRLAEGKAEIKLAIFRQRRG